MTTPLLALENVSAAYGPFRALFDVSFEVCHGQAVALLGTNGAGKTTVARVCSGLMAPTDGRVRFDGVELARHVRGRRHRSRSLPAFEVARMGVSLAPEGRSVFASLSVEENLLLGFRQALGRQGVSVALAEAYDIFPRLGERRSQLAGSLSGGEQRMLALARVLVNPPRLLIVDELSLGLAPIVIDDVYRHLATMKVKGTTLLIVEQHVEHALALADVVVVLVNGEVTYSGASPGIDELSPLLLPSEDAPAAAGASDAHA